MATVRGGPVLAHVQAFCDLVAAEVPGVSAAGDFGTRPDHKPTRARAVDIFVPVADRTRGDKVCALALLNIERFGVRYVIFRQRIWHRLDRRWAPMEDRGAPGPDSQDHYDHVHISFEPTAQAQPTPPPTTPTQEDDMTTDEHKTLYEAKDRAEDARRAAIEAREVARAVERKLDELIAQSAKP